MSNRKHLLWMGGVALAVAAGLTVAGVPLERAAVWALLLACPVMMLTMMIFMGRDSHGHATSDADDAQLGTNSERGVRLVDEQYRR